MSIDGAPDGAPDGGEDKHMFVRPESLFVGADGTGRATWTALAHDMSEGEVREAAIEGMGLDPDSLRVERLDGDDQRRRSGGRNKSRASFGAWNSPWRPGEQPESDPNLN